MEQLNSSGQALSPLRMEMEEEANVFSKIKGGVSHD